VKTPCRDWRERCIAVASKAAPRDGFLAVHLASCSACSLFLARLELHVVAISRLQRARAPRELDGLVVAALQAGLRQERAVNAVASLTPKPMPAAVQPKIQAPRIQAAPRELDRLVVDELRDPTKSIARRLVGHLERQPVPKSLDARVASLAAELPSERRRGRERRRMLAFAGSVFLVIGGLAAILSLVNRGGVEAREPRIVVEHVSSPENMDPAVQATFAMVSGGVFDAKRVAREKL